MHYRIDTKTPILYYYSTMLNVLAQELNTVLEGTSFAALFSDMGERMFFPRGIISQGGEARKHGWRANATIGTTVNDKHPVELPEIQAHLPGLSPEESVAYSPTAGCAALRQVWKEKLLAKNPSLETKGFSLPVVVPGLTAGISYISDLFLSEGDNLIAGDPSWDNYSLIVETRRNAHLKLFPMFWGNAFEGGFNLDAFQKVVDEEAKTGKVHILLNFPQNPSGYTATESEMQQICAIIKGHAEKGVKFLVCCDDAYFGLNYEPEAAKESLFAYVADLHENVAAIKIDGPTKEDYVWGFRCGFMTFAGKGLTEAHYEALQKKLMGIIRSSVSSCNTPAQSILLKAFTSPTLGANKKKFRDILEGRYRRARAAVNKHEDDKVLVPQPFNSGYFMSFTCYGINAEELRQKLLHEQGIGTIAIDANHLRIAFSSLDKRDIDVVFEAVYTVAHELAEK